MLFFVNLVMQLFHVIHLHFYNNGIYGVHLILVTILAILLQSNATKSSAGVQFAEVFTLMLIGSIAVTVCYQKEEHIK